MGIEADHTNESCITWLLAEGRSMNWKQRPANQIIGDLCDEVARLREQISLTTPDQFPPNPSPV